MPATPAAAGRLPPGSSFPSSFSGGAFTGALAEYDSMSRLDPWKTKMLLRAKKNLAKAVEEEEDDLT